MNFNPLIHRPPWSLRPLTCCPKWCLTGIVVNQAKVHRKLVQEPRKEEATTTTDVKEVCYLGYQCMCITPYYT